MVNAVKMQLEPLIASLFVFCCFSFIKMSADILILHTEQLKKIIVKILVRIDFVTVLV